jgi:hypothetical protein
VHANLLGAQQIFKREMEKEERKKNSLCPQRGSKDRPQGASERQEVSIGADKIIPKISVA